MTPVYLTLRGGRDYLLRGYPETTAPDCPWLI